LAGAALCCVDKNQEILPGWCCLAFPGCVVLQLQLRVCRVVFLCFFGAWQKSRQDSATFLPPTAPYAPPLRAGSCPLEACLVTFLRA
jgi:hypothetical protein